MKLNEVYRKIPYELSGAVSKNRFRQEVLWGVSKMFDLFDKPDFCVIFDYKCDIEIHLSDSIEFYQIKTQKKQSPYTFTQLSKSNGGGSTIAKLFVLKDESSDDMRIKCAIVSNRFFSINKKTFSDVERIDFDLLDEKYKSVIQKALQNELGRKKIDLCDLYYVYTSMDLTSPENAIKGKITGCFEKIKGCEPIKPNALYRLIFDTVNEKACYEFSSDDFDELAKFKGITKGELDTMLEKYKEKTDDSVAQIQAYIEKNYEKISERKKYKSALVKIVEAEYKARELQEKEKQISSHIIECESSNTLAETIDDIVGELMNKFKATFSIEYSKAEIYVFILLIIKRWEEGKYA